MGFYTFLKLKEKLRYKWFRDAEGAVAAYGVAVEATAKCEWIMRCGSMQSDIRRAAELRVSLKFGSPFAMQDIKELCPEKNPRIKGALISGDILSTVLRYLLLGGALRFALRQRMSVKFLLSYQNPISNLERSSPVRIGATSDRGHKRSNNAPTASDALRRTEAT
ncbi:hypothetical protein EVAR_44753_1 [Eumeta japonica]|uniref:Uncharacterized protein n=1 Tax=Eumeta variegata TaxID=151549 RepID=A0A4C1XH67_EUMVA|nr:hypothetical protein EVAR_44753_1 [Eumeta japonica]